MLALMFIIPLAIIILMAASVWCIYIKLGLPGWASLVPYYSIHMMGRAVSRETISTVSIALALAGLIANLLGIYSVGGLLILISVIAQYVLWYHVTVARGYGIGFFLGIIFLPIIFFPLLGFSR